MTVPGLPTATICLVEPPASSGQAFDKDHPDNQAYAQVFKAIAELLERGDPALRMSERIEYAKFTFYLTDVDDPNVAHLTFTIRSATTADGSPAVHYIRYPNGEGDDLMLLQLGETFIDPGELYVFYAVGAAPLRVIDELRDLCVLVADVSGWGPPHRQTVTGQ